MYIIFFLLLLNIIIYNLLIHFIVSEQYYLMKYGILLFPFIIFEIQ